MFFRDKQEINSEGNQRIHHTDNDEVITETSIQYTEQPFQLVKPLIMLLIMLTVLYQIWSNYNTFITYIFKLRSIMFHPVKGDDSDAPIFGPLAFDPEASNPIDPKKLFFVIVLCFVMIIPFLI